jgi:hypothetical protein
MLKAAGFCYGLYRYPGCCPVSLCLVEGIVIDPRGEIGRLGLCDAVQRQRHCYDHGLLCAISILLHGAVPCIGCAAFVMVLMQRLDANHALFDS